MKAPSCYGCGEDLPLGELRYVVKIDISAGYDGVMPEYADDVHKEIFSLYQADRGTDLQIPEDDVPQKFYLLLCPSCKEKFAHTLMKETCTTRCQEIPKVIH